jgi:hypothetical protein
LLALACDAEFEVVSEKHSNQSLFKDAHAGWLTPMSINKQGAGVKDVKAIESLNVQSDFQSRRKTATSRRFRNFLEAHTKQSPSF